MSNPRRRFMAALGSTATVAFPYAHAQDGGYPSRPVRIIVPSAPGGSLDAMARILAQKFGEVWKQAVIVENKPGGNFAVGATFVARSPADGYTLLYAHDGLMAKNPALYPSLPYDPLKELAAVGRVVNLAAIIYTTRGLPYENLGELLQAMRSSPGKFNHASGGPSAMFVSELFKASAGVEYVEVPYKGAGPALAAVAAGECHFTFTDPGGATALLKVNRIKALATGTPTRLRLHPELPAIAESVPGFDVSSWSGLVAPAKTPDAVIQKINQDLRNILLLPDVRRSIDGLGLEINPSSPQELDARVRDDIRKWSKLVKERNISIAPS